MSSTGVRITCKKSRPNPLFQEWLEELHREAEEKNSKLEPMLKQALISLSKYPLSLASGSECAILNGFEKKLCVFLDKRLEVYTQNCNLGSFNLSTKENVRCNHEQSLQEVASSNHDNVQHNSDVPISSVLNVIKNKKDKKNKVYKPAMRSGGFAILLALLENSKENPHKPAMNKNDLIEKAQKHSGESFTRPKPESLYTAWSNMNRLVTKGLVVKSRSKKVEYSLTEHGFNIAEELHKEAALIPTVNDIIFNDSMKQNDKIDVELQFNDGSEISTDNSIEMLAGSFDVILLIDKNETGGVSKKGDPTVAQFNKYPSLKHEYRSLKVGDFTWIAQHKLNKQELVLPYIIERKRMDDLAASIKDGRFHEQKFRLRRCGLPNVIYMIENYGKNKHVGLPIQTLMQALANTRVQDGFKVHVTNSLTDSVTFLAMMYKRLTIEYKDKTLKGGDHEPSNTQLMTFNFFNKSSIKTKVLTVTETFIKLLLQLKGISVQKALAITTEYKTPKSLIEEYKKCSGKSGEFLLANIKYGDMGRNVGPAVSKAVYHLFTSLD